MMKIPIMPMMIMIIMRKMPFTPIMILPNTMIFDDAYDEQVWCSLVVASLPSLFALLAVEQENLITKVNIVGDGKQL